MLAKPVVDRLERDLRGQATVLRLSVGSRVGRELAARYGVRGVPTFLVFDGAGRLADHQAGRLDSARIKTEIEAMGR